MSGTQLDVIVDGVRSLLVTQPFQYVESSSPFNFDEMPTGGIDGCFRVQDAGSNKVTAGFRFTETRQDRLLIWVARKHNSDPTTVRRVLTRDMHSITAAVARYGELTTGDFCLVDGRQHEIRPEAGGEYAVLALTVPVDYETQL